MKPGEIGELFLGGIQLARGYLNRPELTAEKFIPHPLDATPGARLYRSGDLARFREDGAIEYCGRIDFQVKIHGYRIELGEIETVLNACGGVKQAVVVPVMKDGKADALAAYWVPDPNQALEESALRAALSKQLPASMVPSHFEKWTRLPLNPNGKIDRKALPPLALMKEPTPSRRAAEAVEFLAPRDALESGLVRIFSDVLKLARLGLRERFVNVGGTSLSALRIVSRLHREAKLDVPIGLIFSAGTLEKTGAPRCAIKEGRGSGQAAVEVVIHEGRAGVAPAVLHSPSFAATSFSSICSRNISIPSVPFTRCAAAAWSPARRPTQAVPPCPSAI